MTHCTCRWMFIMVIVVVAVIVNTGAVGADQAVYNFDPNNGDLNSGYNGNSPWGIPLTDLPAYNGYHLPVREGYASYENQYDFVDDSVNPENQDPTDGNGYYVNTQSPDKGHWYWNGGWDGDPTGWLPGASDHVSPNNNLPSGNGAKVYISAPWSDKAVVAVIGENGPAPWTGRQFGASNKVFEALGLPTSYKQFSRGNPNPGHAPNSGANPADYPVIKYDDNPYWVEFSWADQSLQPGPVNPVDEAPKIINTIAWEFNTPADNEGWLAYNAGILNEDTNVQDDGLFIVDPIGPDPWIENNGLSIDASSVNRIKIKMSSNCEDDTGAIYFSTAESPGFDEDKKVEFSVSHGSEWYGYDIPISENSNWKGIITALRIDPADFGSESSESHDDTFGFDYIRLSRVPTETDTPSDQDTPPDGVVTPDSPTTPPAPAQSAVYTTYYVEDPRIELAIMWAKKEKNSPTYPYNFDCLRYVQRAYITGASSPFTPIGYARKAAEELNAAKNDKSIPPRGAFVFYEWDGDIKDYCVNCGHVGLSIGNGEIIHNYEKSIKIQNYKSLNPTLHPYVGWAYPPVTPPISNIYPLSGNLYGSADKKDITGIFNSSTSKFTFGSKSVQFGLDTDIPVIGDWDGDGKDEIGVFRPSDDKGISKFYLVTRNWSDLGDKAGDADKCIDFAPYPTNVPITGDWDGDGYDGIGGFNPENNVFYLYKLDLDTSSSKSYKDVPFGATGDIPFIGDWDGDGKDELGVFRSPYPAENPGTNAFYCDRKLTGDQHELGEIGNYGKPKPYTYGDLKDYPVIGDWDGDGDDDIGVYRPHNKKFCKDNPVHDVNSDGVINLSDFVGALKDTIMGMLNSISL